MRAQFEPFCILFIIYLLALKFISLIKIKKAQIGYTDVLYVQNSVLLVVQISEVY